MQNNKGNNERKAKNSEARIRANNKYTNANYQNINIKIRPEQAEIIRNTAKQFDISIAQLIINSVNEYKMNHGADPAQPEQDPTKSPMESGETAGAQPEQQEEETGNEIDTEEEQAAGAEEPAEEEAEDIPEELKAVRAAWARMGAFNEKITAERKRREAEERERRREITDEERYMMR